jgi:hypothetical protein
MISGQVRKVRIGRTKALTSPKIKANQIKDNQFVLWGVIPWPFIIAIAAYNATALMAQRMINFTIPASVLKMLDL